MQNPCLPPWVATHSTHEVYYAAQALARGDLNGVRTCRNPARSTPFDLSKTTGHVMMRCGGRKAAHCAGFHQISPGCWLTRNRNGSSSVRRASMGSSQIKKNSV